MYVILLFAILTLAFIGERLSALYFKLKLAPSTLRKELQAMVLRGDFRGAEAHAIASAGETSLGKIAAVGCRLRANATAEEEVQARMDETLSREISSIDRRTGFLGMFGNVATLVGLLGTIVGMIHSFAAVAQANPADRASMLSQGIAEAMNCTAFGLLTAIPALVAYAVFQNKTDRVVTDITESTTEIYHDLIFLTEGNLEEGSSKKSKNKSSENLEPQVSM